MKNLEVEKKYTLRFTPDQWGLFDMEGSVEAANYLNGALQDLINNGYSKMTILDMMGEHMKKHKEVGAYDSEPLWFLEDVLNEVFRD